MDYQDPVEAIAEFELLEDINIHSVIDHYSYWNEEKEEFVEK